MCFMWRENWTGRKASQNFNPRRRNPSSSSLSGAWIPARSQRWGRGEGRRRKWNGKRENYHTALLFRACENIIPLCFECSMCLLCFSHPWRRSEAREAAAAAPESECGSEFSAAQRNVIYFLGKMKMSVRGDEICGASRRCFWLWFRFCFRLSAAKALVVFIRAPHPEKKSFTRSEGIKGACGTLTVPASAMIYVRINVTDFARKRNPWDVTKHLRHSAGVAQRGEEGEAIENCNFAVCNSKKTFSPRCAENRFRRCRRLMIE